MRLMEPAIETINKIFGRESKKQAAARDTYNRLVRSMGANNDLTAGESEAMREASCALGYTPEKVAEDVEAVREVARLRAMAADLDKTVSTLEKKAGPDIEGRIERARAEIAQLRDHMDQISATAHEASLSRAQAAAIVRTRPELFPE